MSLDNGREQTTGLPAEGGPQEHAERGRLRGQVHSGLLLGGVFLVLGIGTGILDGVREGYWGPSWNWFWATMGLVSLSQAWWSRRALTRTPPCEPPPANPISGRPWQLGGGALVVLALAALVIGWEGYPWGLTAFHVLVAAVVTLEVAVHLPWCDRWTMRPRHDR